MWRKIGIPLVLLLALTAWWGTQRYATGDDSLPPLETVTVDRGEVSQRVVAYGSLQPVDRVEVGSQVSGIVDEVRVDFNSRVRRGDVVALIDPSTFEAEVRSAEAELESTEASLELARHQWQRTQELREQQFVSPSDVDEARASLAQAEAALRVRQHALERARRELERCTIRAPADGVVISRQVDVGQTVAASLNAPILFEIAADLSRMHIHASVSEADIGRVEEGQTVRFAVDAYREEEFGGEIIQVRNAPMMEDNVVHYETIIAVDNEDGRLKPGMTAEVSIIVEERTDVLRVRNTALRARLPDQIRPPEPADEDALDGRVYLVSEDDLEAIPVRTGLADGVHTEILEGQLSEGDRLAVGLSLGATGRNEGRRSLFSGQQAQF
ncbi:MAG: efflux RND transporter periplasmic adaptor subunit [Gemmatimonadales bacterium]|nr:MAG: efflux RND transporter periplasmic adaptor subunit [Gemmatimonadales bacterium]